METQDGLVGKSLRKCLRRSSAGGKSIWDNYLGHKRLTARTKCEKPLGGWRRLKKNTVALIATWMQNVVPPRPLCPLCPGGNQTTRCKKQQLNDQAKPGPTAFPTRCETAANPVHKPSSISKPLQCLRGTIRKPFCNPLGKPTSKKQPLIF